MNNHNLFYEIIDLILQWNWELTLFGDSLDSIPNDSWDKSVLRARFRIKSRHFFRDTMKNRYKTSPKRLF